MLLHLWLMKTLYKQPEERPTPPLHPIHVIHHVSLFHYLCRSHRLSSTSFISPQPSKLVQGQSLGDPTHIPPFLLLYFLCLYLFYLSFVLFPSFLDLLFLCHSYYCSLSCLFLLSFSSSYFFVRRVCFLFRYACASAFVWPVS